MRHEYEAIVYAGLVLQIDSPDLGLGRHKMFKDKSLGDYQRLAALHVEVLNHALRNCPADRLRMHICWGNYEGPHHHDVPMEVVLPIALRAKPQGLLFEASNPRHAHEWTVFRDTALPADKILIPGVLDSVVNFIEHPLLIAQRIVKFSDMVGREGRSYAGSTRAAGYGTRKMGDIIATANLEAALVAQIEDARALDAIDGIAAVQASTASLSAAGTSPYRLALRRRTIQSLLTPFGTSARRGSVMAARWACLLQRPKKRRVDLTPVPHCFC